jgi:hypothetical protein
MTYELWPVIFAIPKKTRLNQYIKIIIYYTIFNEIIHFKVFGSGSTALLRCIERKHELASSPRYSLRKCRRFHSSYHLWMPLAENSAAIFKKVDEKKSCRKKYFLVRHYFLKGQKKGRIF